MADLYVNDCPLTRFGLQVEDPGEWQNSPQFTIPTATILYRAGEVRLGQQVQAKGKLIQLRCALKQTTQAAYLAAFHQMKDRIAHGQVELRFADEPDKYYVASLQEATLLDYTGPKLLSPFSRLGLSFLALNPFRYSVEPTVVGFGAAPTPCPLGTAPSLPVIRLYSAIGGGSVVNPVVTLRDISGAAQGSLTFTITLNSGEVLEINAETGVIQKLSTAAPGVYSNQYSTLAVGSDLFALDPSLGDYFASAWCTLETTQGLGEASYKKAWL